jgi:hypothetical protein
MLPEDGVSAVGTVVRLIEAGVHQEGHAAADGSHAAADKGAPEEGRVAALLVHHSGHIRFAAGTV